MAHFTIKAPHDPDHHDAGRMRESLTHAGSYFLAHATWGCEMGDHCVWLDVEAECEDEVRLMVPPLLRPRATVILRPEQKRSF